jgi:hypothetical protein
VDGERGDWVRGLRKSRYRKPCEGRQEKGGWWMEKRAWGSRVSPRYTLMWATTSLELEEMAQSTVAAADPGAALRWKTGGVCQPKRRKRVSDGGFVAGSVTVQ